MIAITAINGVLVLLIVFSSREAYATTAGPTKCYAGGSFDMAKTKIADTASIAASASCTKFCMNETKGMLSTLQ